jgi:hypothetical protein
MKKNKSNPSLEIDSNEQFADWLTSFPLDAMKPDAEFTIEVPVTMNVASWMFVAKAAAAHGLDLGELISYALTIPEAAQEITEMSNCLTDSHGGNYCDCHRPKEGDNLPAMKGGAR